MLNYISTFALTLMAVVAHGQPVDPANSKAIVEDLKKNFCAEKGIESADYSFYSFTPEKMQAEMQRLRDERDYAKILNSAGDETIESLQKNIVSYQQEFNEALAREAMYQALSKVLPLLKGLLDASIAMNEISATDRDNIISFLAADSKIVELAKSSYEINLPKDWQSTSDDYLKKSYEATIADYDQRIKKYTEAIESMKTSATLEQVAKKRIQKYAYGSMNDVNYYAKLSAGDAVSYKKKIEIFQKKLAALEKAAASAGQTEPKETFESLEAEIEAMGYSTEPTWELTSNGYAKCGITPIEFLAIQRYTGSDYTFLNSALRSDDVEKKKKVRAFAAVLNRALKKFKPYTGYVNRGTDDLPSAVLKQHTTGSLVEYKAFTSTSFGKGFGGMYKFRILSKSARLIDPFSSNPHEDEVLFPASTKFLIKESKDDGYYQTFIMEEVN